MKKTLAHLLTQIIEDSLTKFETLSQDTWQAKPLPKKWSKIEILGHLIDSAHTNLQRFVRVQYDDKTNLYYEQDFWVKANDYQNQGIASITTLWQVLNLQIVRVWLNTNESTLQKTIPVMDEMPKLQFLMEDYIDHLNHHLNQITSEK